MKQTSTETFYGLLWSESLA